MKTQFRGYWPRQGSDYPLTWKLTINARLTFSEWLVAQKMLSDSGFLVLTYQLCLTPLPDVNSSSTTAKASNSPGS